jgi:catechol 2,3-dioxygenase-like lactoylglutathione lyase family enzyme
MKILGIDHVQVAAPPGCEPEARAFYGELLGLEEVPKPETLPDRAGCWFRAGAQELHVGIEQPFTPAMKAHPGFVVDNLAALTARLRANGTEVRPDEKLPGVERCLGRAGNGERWCLEVNAEPAVILEREVERDGVRVEADVEA